MSRPVDDDLAIPLERWLLRLLPAGWEVRTLASQSGGGPTAVDLCTPDGASRRLIVVADEHGPLSLHDYEARAEHRGVLVVAPWISPRLCETLRDRNVNYVDSTGNVRLVLDDPPVVLLRDGAASEPDERNEQLLRRRKAIALMRYLVDEGSRTKHRVKELSAATGLSSGYISQLLRALEAKGLVRRNRHGRVEQVSLDGMLLQLGESYDPAAFNDAYSFTRTIDTGDLLDGVGRIGRDVLVTGSTAAAHVATVPAAHTFMAYTNDPLGVARELRLKRERDRGEVVLLQPYEPFLLEHAWSDGRSWFTAVPQIAVDCLGSRDVTAGMAVVRWALDHVDAWRSN